MEERVPYWLMGTNAPVRQDLWEHTVNSGVNASPIPVEMEVLVTMSVKAMSAHAQKASEERTAKNRTSVIPIPVGMVARVLESLKRMGSSARVEKDSKGKTVKKSISVFLILVKMVQHVRKEPEEDMNVLVQLATKASHVKKEAFVILTHACMAVPVLMRLTVTDALVELDTAALTANITCASQIPVTMVVLASRRARLLDACVKLVTMETDVNY